MEEEWKIKIDQLCILIDDELMKWITSKSSKTYDHISSIHTKLHACLTIPKTLKEFSILFIDHFNISIKDLKKCFKKRKGIKEDMWTSKQKKVASLYLDICNICKIEVEKW